MEALDADETYHRLINHHRQRSGMLFGNMFSYSDGTNQLMLIADPNAESFPIEQIAPPADKDGKRREFLESILYFGIYGNHVILLQSTGLRGKQFEQHINWLLLDTKMIGSNENVLLADHPSRATKDKITSVGVKKIVIGKPLVEFMGEANVAATARQQRDKRLKFAPEGLGIDMLQRLIGDAGMRRLKLEDALDANLQISLEIKFKRTTTDEGQDLLDTIATSLRNIDVDEYYIDLNKGGRVEGNEIKLFTPMSVVTTNGLVDQSDLFTKMQQWLTSQLENGLIDP
jgi:hypothetical protein